MDADFRGYPLGHTIGFFVAGVVVPGLGGRGLTTEKTEGRLELREEEGLTTEGTEYTEGREDLGCSGFLLDWLCYFFEDSVPFRLGSLLGGGGLGG